MQTSRHMSEPGPPVGASTSASTSLSPSTAAGRAWARWRAFARRAAEVQSHVLMWLLYWVAFVPIASIQRRTSDPLDLRRSDSPAWREREPLDADLPRARRQF